MSLTEALNRFTELGAEWVLWLLIGLSIVSVAIMVERAIALYRCRGDAGALARAADDLLAAGKREELRKKLAAMNCVHSRVLSSGLEKYDRGAAAAEEAMRGVQVRERLQLERNLAYLGTVGSNAPFIGLAGTVIGIMQAFRNLGADLQAAGNDTVMAAIAEALVATLVGLMVAVPAVVAFNFFQRRVKTTMAKTEIVVHALVGHLRGRGDDGPEDGRR
jgi:biopolymer transport protein ExbB